MPIDNSRQSALGLMFAESRVAPVWAPSKYTPGMGEHCKLPQLGLGQSPSHQGFNTSEVLRKASPDISVVLLLLNFHQNRVRKKRCFGVPLKDGTATSVPSILMASPMVTIS